jgi:inosose dehydratase
MKRRELIKGAAMVASLPVTRLGAGEAADAVTPPAGDRWRGLKAGVASYTLRKMPVDAAVAAVNRVGLSYVSIKDFHLPLDSTTEQRKAVAAQFKAAGITPLSVGNVTM